MLGLAVHILGSDTVQTPMYRDEENIRMIKLQSDWCNSGGHIVGFKRKKHVSDFANWSMTGLNYSSLEVYIYFLMGFT